MLFCVFFFSLCLKNVFKKFSMVTKLTDYDFSCR